MDNLRLILILAGLLVVAIIYLIGRRREQKTSEMDTAEYSAESAESSIPADEWDSLSFSSVDSDSLDEASPLLANLRQGAKLQRQRLEDSALDSMGALSAGDDEEQEDRDWYVVLTVIANEGERFRGEAIHQTLQQAGLQFGEMDIYHDYAAGSEGVSLTSVANILEPGTLIAEEQDDLLTPGLVMLLRLPTVMDGEEALDRMLDIAEELAKDLGGQVCDQKRQPLGEEAIEDLLHKASEYPVLPVLSLEME